MDQSPRQPGGGGGLRVRCPPPVPSSYPPLIRSPTQGALQPRPPPQLLPRAPHPAPSPDLYDRTDAATRIQSQFRGFAVRRQPPPTVCPGGPALAEGGAAPQLRSARFCGKENSPPPPTLPPVQNRDMCPLGEAKCQAPAPQSHAAGGWGSSKMGT